MPRDPIFMQAMLTITALVMVVLMVRLWARRQRRAPAPRSSGEHAAPAPVAPVPPTAEGKAVVTGQAQALPDGDARARRDGIVSPAPPAKTIGGLPRCTASDACMEVAIYSKPAIIRDDGWKDFVRRAFGAPRRYRISPAVLVKEGQVPRYCAGHVHLVHQACVARLAQDEVEQATHELEREVGLAEFEFSGLERTVNQMVTAHEQRVGLPLSTRRNLDAGVGERPADGFALHRVPSCDGLNTA